MECQIIRFRPVPPRRQLPPTRLGRRDRAAGDGHERVSARAYGVLKVSTKTHDQPAPLPTSLREHYEWLLARADAPPSRLLDIGAGQGRLLGMAREVVRERLVGIDPKSPGKHPDHPIARVVGDGQRLPFAQNTFDFVVETETLEWVRDPVSLLREAARVCTPDGVVVSDDTDWDTVVFAAGDAVLGRRILRAFCDSVRTAGSVAPRPRSCAGPDCATFRFTSA